MKNENKKVKAIGIILVATMLISVFVAIALAMSAVQADDSDLEGIRKAIGESGAEWQADHTSVSGLSFEEKQRLCGLKIRGSMKNIIEIESTSSAPYSRYVSQPPDAFDWRDNNGDWTTPIRDQGPCGSCWAFGSLCSMESCINIQKNDPTFDQDLSEQQLLSCSPGDCDGWTESGVLNWLRDYGTVDEACFPYQADDTIPCYNHCPTWKCSIWKITDWGWIPSSTSAIKENILNAPIVTGMAVYEDFWSYDEGIYEHVWGGLVGYHLVNMVGYNEVEDYWICKNSWGTGWGEDGWFRIKYGECNIENMNAYIEPPIIEPCPAESAVYQAGVPDPDAILNPLRELRDGYLKEEYVDSYYDYSSELSMVMTKDPALAYEAARLLVKYSPMIEQQVTGTGKVKLITGRDVEEVVSFTDGLKRSVSKNRGEIGATRSQEIIKFLDEFKEQVEASEGKTFSEALQSSIYFESDKENNCFVQE